MDRDMRLRKVDVMYQNNLEIIIKLKCLLLISKPECYLNSHR